jgi:O-antigen/teichoic acid export membrane protein
MIGFRRRLLLGSAGRYLSMATGIVTAAVVGRFLTPAEFGLAVLGGAVFGIAEAVRELASPTYLVQRRELTTDAVRTIFSINLITTLVVLATILATSVPLARLYGMPGLETYIYLTCVSYATGPLVYPIFGLLSRQMAFHKIALLDCLTALVSAGVTVVLLALGNGYKSLAWAAIASSLTSVVIGFLLWRDLSIYRFSLKEWRGVLSFGVFGSTTALLNTTSDAIFYLVAGKMMNPGAIGLLQRSLLLANFPERVMSAAISVVALPSFSNHAREGGDLRSAYLTAVEYVTGVEWPALICLTILAHPVVTILLGSKWEEVVPIMAIIGAALLMNFPSLLNNPIQIASGGIRYAAVVTLAQVLLSLTARIVSGHYGVIPVAYAIALTVPLNAMLSLVVLRRQVPFRWLDFGRAIRKSAVAAALCAMGLLLAVGIDPWRTPVAFEDAIGGAMLGTVGWLAGLWVTDHSIWREIARMRAFWLVGRPRYLKGVRN